MSFFKKMNSKLNGKVKEQLDDINNIIRKDSQMSELEQKYSTANIEKIMTQLADIVVSILDAVKDGIQVTDAFVIPTLITKTVSIMEQSDEASKELQDLTIEEISYLIGVLAQEVLKVFVATKKA